MTNYSDQVQKCKGIIEELFRCPNIAYSNIGTQLFQEVTILSEILPDEYEMYKQNIKTKILPNLLIKGAAMNSFGQIVPNADLGVAPVQLGELIATLRYIEKSQGSSTSGIDWHVIHPLIRTVSQERYNVAQYADSVEAAFKTINNAVKVIVLEITGEEMDGNSLMQKAFNKNNPLIKFNEIDRITAQDIQQGYQFMFSGAILGIRNPKAHEVESISKEDAIRKLHFASMLMYKLDSRIKGCPSIHN